MNTRPTSETDAFAIKFKTTCGEKYWVPVDIARRLESERDEARGQANDMREKWLAKGLCCEHLGAELHEAINQRDEARGQRDRLAEVIEAASVLIAAKGRDARLQRIARCPPIPKPTRTIIW